MAVDNLRQTQYDYVDVSYLVTTAHPQNNPQVYSETHLGHVILESVTIVWPRGALWVVGFALFLAGAQLVPQGSVLTFATGNDHEHEYIVGIEVDTGLTVELFNLGTFTHTVFVTYKTSTIGVDSVSPTGGPTPQTGSLVGPTGAPVSAPPITVVPSPPPPIGGPPVTTTLTPPGSVALDPSFIALQQTVNELGGRVQVLETTVAALQQQLHAIVATTPGPNPVPVTTPPAPGGPGTTTPGTTAVGGTATPPAPVGPTVQLPAPGSTVALSNGAVVNPYQAGGSLNLNSLGAIAADNGGKVTVVLPSGATLPVTHSTLGGFPYTCIGTSC